MLDVSGGATYNGAGVIQWYATGAGNQRWNLVDQGDATETVVNQNSGKCLTTDGVPAQLRNPASGFVMDVNGSSSSAGTAIDTWYDNYGDNQYFSYWQLG